MTSLRTYTFPHIAAGVRQDDSLSLYLDGELQAQKTIGSKRVKRLNVNIGLEDATEAVIEDVQLFDYALFPEEIAATSVRPDPSASLRIKGIVEGPDSVRPDPSASLRTKGIVEGSEPVLSLSKEVRDESLLTPLSDDGPVLLGDGDGTVVTTTITYYYINGQRVAQAKDGVFTWIHADHLSSATRITDAAGLEIRRLAYASFGEEAENQGTGDEPKYTYTGKEQDSTGLYYYGARYYDPALSRFITADTVYDAGPQGLNRYAYALNNPIRYNDPTGRYARGDKTNTLSKFMRVFRQWEIEAEKHRQVSTMHHQRIPIREPKNSAKIRVFDTDFRADPQIFVREVGDNKQFSYHESFGQSLDVGLPLDVGHFFKMARLAEVDSWPNSIVRWQYVREEFKQTKDPRPRARTSAFAPEDLFSNELGLMFAECFDPNDNMADELEAFLKEVKTLFTTGTLSDGKYLTDQRIAKLKEIAKKYYGTEDLTFFTKDSDIYIRQEIEKINDNAEKRDYPFYKEKTSPDEEGT